MSPLPDSLITKRAEEIFAENRHSFNIGPAPFAVTITIGNDATGEQWQVHLSVYSAPERVEEMVGTLSTLVENNPGYIPMALARVAAISELTLAMVNGWRRTEVPRG